MSTLLTAQRPEGEPVKHESLNASVAVAVFGHKTVSGVPFVRNSEDGREFAADFGPNNTRRGIAVVSKFWNGKDATDDHEIPKYAGVPEVWLEPVPDYAGDARETEALKKALLDYRREEFGGMTSLAATLNPYTNRWVCQISWSDGTTSVEVDDDEKVAWCKLAARVSLLKKGST